MNNPAAANRVATIIATAKWIVVGLIALGVVIMMIAGIATVDDGGFAFVLAAPVVGAIYAIIVYVLFGWFEQTLRMLASIAHNTAGGMVTPGGGQPSHPPEHRTE